MLNGEMYILTFCLLIVVATIALERIEDLADTNGSHLKVAETKQVFEAKSTQAWSYGSGSLSLP